MSPCSPQPKQCQVSRSGVTMNDGVFSPWNGQSPFDTLPARLSATVSPTISRAGSFDLISATIPEEVAMVRVPSAVMRLSIAFGVPRGSFYHLSSGRSIPERGGYLSRVSVWVIAACAAASRATGTRNGEQLT